MITGAGSGMGRAYAIEFAKLGSHLALNDRDEAGLAETGSLAKKVGAKKCFSKAFDVSIKNEMDAFASEVKQQLGNAHVVINNAGIEGSTLPAFHTEEERFRKVMDVNFFGVVNGTKAFLPQMVENGEGALVNVSSVFGLIGTPNNADYCASKFAVRGFTEALLVEFHGSPISIHIVHPGGINTNIVRNERALDFAKEHLITPPEKIAKHVIKCIGKRKFKIVYGHNSMKVWLGSNLIPKNILKRLIWREVNQFNKAGEYDAFNPNAHR